MLTTKIELSQSKPLKYKWPNTHMVEGSMKGNRNLAVGIDPGANFGLTVINMEYVQIVYGHLPPTKDVGRYGISAYEYIMDYFRVVGDKFFIALRSVAVVEGAAYNAQYGQSMLEEVRFGFYLALYHLGFDVRILPPASVRKIAFGYGKQQAGDIWPLLKHDAAASVGCALAALEISNGSKGDL